MRRQYHAPVKYSASALDRARAADLLIDARASYRETRPGGFWHGNAMESAALLASAARDVAESRRLRGKSSAGTT